MNEIIKIENVRCFIGEDNIAYLNLEDVAIGLGFVEIAQSGNKVIRWRTVRQYLKDLNVIATSCDGIGKNNLPEFIPENIFYRFCMKANNEVAKIFQSLVCDIILPQIRKTGGYIPIMDNDDEENLMARALIIAQKTLARKNEIIAQQKPKVEYYDKVLDAENTLTITQIAKSFGMSGVRLNKILHDSGI